MNMQKPFSFDVRSLDKIKRRYKAGDAKAEADVALLLKDADQALGKGPFSVTFKEAIAPSGDKHDYVSLSRYKWPNPDTPDGLPYIKRDGESNPELEQYDRKPLGDLCECVSHLGLAYYLTDDEQYATHMVKLLWIWFLDEDTRMNPHFNHGSFVPGINEGSKGGTIAGVRFLRLLNAICFLSNYKNWTEADQRMLELWFRALRDWILTSEFGRKELASKNNHGIWADAQVLGISIFLGEETFAFQHIKEHTLNRFVDHFQADGSQPNELRRTNSKSYCEYNLNAWIEVATFSNYAGFDLWNYQTSDGKSLRKAVEWFIPFILYRKEWPYQQIGMYQPGKMIPHLHRIAVAYQEMHYKKIADQLKGAEKLSGRTRLLYLPEIL